MAVHRRIFSGTSLTDVTDLIRVLATIASIHLWSGLRRLLPRLPHLNVAQQHVLRVVGHQPSAVSQTIEVRGLLRVGNPFLNRKLDVVHRLGRQDAPAEGVRGGRQAHAGDNGSVGLAHARSAEQSSAKRVHRQPSAASSGRADAG